MFKQLANSRFMSLMTIVMLWAPTATAPTVTINQAGSQPDPTSMSPVRFTATFSESVSGFTSEDVTIGGTAPGSKTVTITGGPATYQVAVTGMTGPGTVNATIAADVAVGTASGLGNLSSTSADNVVTFQTPPPPTITSFTPTTGIAGTVVTISGTNLSTATAVSFNGTPAASFIVNSTFQLITNPGFELGLTGWTVSSQSGGQGSFHLDTGNTSPVTGQATAGPHAGTYLAITDGISPGAHALIQPFTMPSPATRVTLSFSMFVNDWDSGPHIHAAGLDYNAFPNQHGRVDILSAAAGPLETGTGVLRNFYLNVDPHSNPNPYTNYSVDITDLVGAGGTFQLRFAEVDNQFYLNMGVDDVNIVFEPQSPTIQAIVPVGATTGPITITTPGGMVTSSANFVLPAELTITQLAPVTAELFGTDQSQGNLLKVDPVTGAGTVVGPMGVGITPALAIDPTTGFMYTATGTASSSLYRVNPLTGVTTLVGSTGLGEIGDLAFAFNGTLYAVVNTAGDAASGSDRLATINKSTGAASLIGAFGSCGATSCTIEGIEGLAFDAVGNLYGAHTGQSFAGLGGLYRINPATGGATFIVPIVDSSGVPPSGGVTSLQFAPDGTVFGGTGIAPGTATDGGRLININSTTGVFSFVGSFAATPLLTSLGGLSLRLHSAGTSLVYTIQVKNFGSAAANNVTVTDVLPIGVSFVSCSSSVGSCSAAGSTVTASLGTLATGNTATIQIQVTVPIGTTINNTAAVTTSSVELITTNNLASLSLIVDPKRRTGQLTSQ